MDGGDLSKALGRKEGFAFWGQRGHLIALDVILGLQYLHDNNMYEVVLIFLIVVLWYL
jgi:hypothetical protein